MNANRLTAAAALAVAALALTACGPKATTGAAAPSAAPSGPSTSASAAPAALPAAPSASATRSADAKPTPTTSAKPSAAKPTSTTPVADCAKNAHRVLQATENGYSTSVWMRAKATKFVCGPDVPNDGYYEGYGNPEVYTFSNDVKTSLMIQTDSGLGVKSVDLPTFMKHMDDCLTDMSTVARPYFCFGNMYAVEVNDKKVITSIDEVYKP